jgi:hypothetical protein
MPPGNGVRLDGARNIEKMPGCARGGSGPTPLPMAASLIPQGQEDQRDLGPSSTGLLSSVSGSQFLGVGLAFPICIM